MDRERPAIGWREWVALPELGIPGVKVKVDTGARTSALHAFDIELRRRAGRRIVRFKVHPFQRDTKRTVLAEAELIDERMVRNTSGKQHLRPVVKTPVELMGERWDIELTLVGRDEMGFRMLLGREAVRGRFVVDPGRSFCSRKLKTKLGKNKKEKKEGRKKGKKTRLNKRQDRDGNGTHDI